MTTREIRDRLKIIEVRFSNRKCLLRHRIFPNEMEALNAAIKELRRLISLDIGIKKIKKEIEERKDYFQHENIACYPTENKDIIYGLDEALEIIDKYIGGVNK